MPGLIILRLVLGVGLCCGTAWSLTLLNSNDASRVAHVHLKVDRHVREVRDVDDVVHVRFMLNGEPVNLQYLRNKRLDKDFPVLLVGDSQHAINYKTSKRDWAAYQGLNHEGAVIIRDKNDKRSVVEVEGYIHRNKKWLLIQPTKRGYHTLHEIKDENDYKSKRTARSADSDMPFISSPGDNDVYRRKRADLSAEMNIELKINFDYSIYTQWTDRTRGDFVDDAARKAQVITNMEQYYVLLINAIDLRFTPIRTAGINLHVVLGGLLISETQSGSSWTEYDHISGGSFDKLTAINKFIQWLKDENISFDHFQIHSTRVDGGKAWYHSTCTENGVSYAADFINIVSARVSSHEIMHSFGVRHDPDDADCPYGSLMASSGPSYGVYGVSSCTINQLTTELNAKIDSQYACLKSKTSDVSQFNGYLSQDLGQMYSPHEQCWLRFGGDFHVNWGKFNEFGLESICEILRCTKPNYPGNSWLMEAFPHTSCGDKKWCELGVCVANGDAPSHDAYCPLGDYHDCAGRVIASTLGQCYEGGTLHKECCTTCKRNKLSDTNCPYGASHHACQQADCGGSGTNACCSDYCGNGGGNGECPSGDVKSGCQGEDCYNSQGLADCCTSCKGWKTGVTGCLYGDWWSKCAWVAPLYCYSFETECCARCAVEKANRNDENCPFGDKIAQHFCLLYGDPKQCYTKRQDCCETCKNLITGPEGCEWGDKVSGCTSASCATTQGSTDCCHTCK